MFEDVTGVENLLEAWREFLRGKRGKPDVQEFGLRLMDNVFALRRDLVHRTYHHGRYIFFKVNDPKPRDIHKAPVRDRLLHHAIYRVLYPYFDRTFIADSFSCRVGKGTHRAMNRFRTFGYKVSRNSTRTCWILKCDVCKFFASVDHRTLLGILERQLKDNDVMWLLGEIVCSFHSGAPGTGLPLGNLTSQLFSNVYMNEFDRFMEHTLKEKRYLRYADDFVIFSEGKKHLEGVIKPIDDFLSDRLKLCLHKDKIFVKTLASGVDFLGWVHFSDHRVLRMTTKRRMFEKVNENSAPETVNSYLGLLRHGNARKLDRLIRTFPPLRFVVE